MRHGMIYAKPNIGKAHARNILAEANKGEDGPKLPRWLKPYFQWILPILILVILIQGLL